MRFNLYGVLLAATTVMTLSGCVTFTPVKDIVENPGGFLDTNFNESKINDSVKATLGTPTTAQLQRTVVLGLQQTYTENDKKTEYTQTATFKVYNDGLVRTLWESKSNGILTSYEFELAYGVNNLLYQFASTRMTNASFPQEYKSITQVDKGFNTPAPNSTYRLNFTFGTSAQLANFTANRAVCSSGDYISASTINTSLTGKALPFNCERYGFNDQLFRKDKYFYLEDLAIFVPQEFTTSSDKRTYTVTQVTVN